MNADAKKTILVSPLNWGLGHATRMAPVINALLNHGHRVIIGSYGSSAQLLKKEFEDCTHVYLPGFTPRYSSSHSQTFTLMLQGLNFVIKKHLEHRRIREILKEYDVDLIISDNRYGVRHKKVTSVIVTHQLNPALGKPFRVFEKPVAHIFSRWIKKFDECWVPDTDSKPNISGDLSENISGLQNVRYAGSLSRFSECKQRFDYKYDHTAVISGPEPWRSRFEKDLVRLFIKMGGESVIVRGVAEGTEEEYLYNGITMIDHLRSEALNRVMCNSRNIICRPGYSTLMDLFAMGRRALLIPTPGQPEQEYLAGHLQEKHGFIYFKQENIPEIDASVFNRFDKNSVSVKNNMVEILLQDVLK